MTAILAIISPHESAVDDSLVTRMLDRMQSRGGARASVWREGPAVVAVSRHEWELDRGFSGPVLIVQDGDHVITADASLYYRDDLRRKLTAKGIKPKGETSSHLILAAYQAFGEKCPEVLEGDFSFIIWDRKDHKIVAARDSTGTRPLFFAEFGGTLIIASAIAAILEHPACSTTLDLTSIAVDAAGVIFATNDQTAYRDVRRLNAAMTLVRSQGRARLSRHWEPTTESASADPSLDNGAEKLRALLTDAVTERLDPSGRTAVWLSGGWDSTAVFAAGQSALCQQDKPDQLVPISMSLPPDDPWCETTRTAAFARHWGVDIHWLKSEDIPLLVAPEASARKRPEPWAHEYEQMMRALVSSTRAEDARVALNGHGGDFLFHSSPVILADLLTRGRMLRLWREWQAMPVRKPRAFIEYAIQPVLPVTALRVATWLRRGRRLHGYMERPIPFWFDRSFARSSGLVDRAAAASPQASRRISRSSAEAQWLLTQPHFDRVVSTTAGFALEDGVESRLPLLDRRVVDFALTRPWWERRSAGERKHLIKHAMKDMLPSEVLAPRPLKTGALGGYFARSVRRVLPELLHLAQAPLLAEFGIIDGARFRNAVNVYSRSNCSDIRLGVPLLATLQAELWLRAHTRETSTASFEFTKTTAGVVT